MRLLCLKARYNIFWQDTGMWIVNKTLMIRFVWKILTLVEISLETEHVKIVCVFIIVLSNRFKYIAEKSVF